MRVLKFGGTSVGSAERMKSVAGLINDGVPKIVVLSAMSGTTNNLVEIAKAFYQKDSVSANKLINELNAKYDKVILELYKTEKAVNKGKELIKNHFDYLRSFNADSFRVNEERAILAQGELISTALFHYFMEENNIPSVLLAALDFMRIDENDEPDLASIETHLKKILANHKGDKLFITQGYICRDPFGSISNLKRGGSDYTATLIGAALYSDEVQIWTDIDGMHNNDPRIVEKTKPVSELSFDEAAELAYFGAKILHPTCVNPARFRKIPVRLLNTMQPKAKGTVISDKSTGDTIKAVAAKDDIIAINIVSGRMLMAFGFLRSVFEVFERYKTPIDMITTSEVAVSLTIDDPKNLDAIVKELAAFATINVDHEQTIICIVGDFLADKSG
ncbi:MAG: aspartate kinase, partial [Bacteroidia bacterium]|nr:aspartate kinase [Bacteroidia bacterium]